MRVDRFFARRLGAAGGLAAAVGVSALVGASVLLGFGASGVCAQEPGGPADIMDPFAAPAASARPRTSEIIDPFPARAASVRARAVVGVASALLDPFTAGAVVVSELLDPWAP